MTHPLMHTGASSSEPSNEVVKNDRSFFFYVIVALAIALIIRFFIAAPFIVVGSSMEPGFTPWNYLIVDRVTYRFGTPERGDVVVLKLPQNENRDLIKRIVGLPGETIRIEGSNPRVTIINATHPEGFTLDEPYVSSINHGNTSDMTVTLGDNQYFVLGDNRKVSADSRIWGVLPAADIVGRVLLRLYPFSDIGTFPVEARYVEDRSL